MYSIDRNLMDRLAEAEAAIEHDILVKEIRLVREILGIRGDSDSKQYTLKKHGCACAVGCYLIGRRFNGSSDPIEDAADLLDVPYLWVEGLTQGFDRIGADVPSEEPFDSPRQKSIIERGREAGIRLAQKYHPTSRPDLLSPITHQE